MSRGGRVTGGVVGGGGGEQGRLVVGRGGVQTRSPCSDGKLQAWLLSWSLEGSER